MATDLRFWGGSSPFDECAADILQLSTDWQTSAPTCFGYWLQPTCFGYWLQTSSGRSLHLAFAGLLQDTSQYASGRPSSHRLVFPVFLCFQARAQTFPKVQAATASFSCSPSDLSLSKLTTVSLKINQTTFPKHPGPSFTQLLSTFRRFHFHIAPTTRASGPSPRNKRYALSSPLPLTN